MSEALSVAAVEARLAAEPTLADWRLGEGRLRRELVFEDFNAAFAFMTRVARLAEEQSHHPEWSNVYQRVSISLWTHDAGGISERDFRLALGIEAARRA